ncbi:hypothetical protein [Candidatus Reidiella endopervernicosa]|uniref:DinB/UmuC family translesion DNA polymerase n=1 Tax=Candidatus Reidiella endopervernicosa TaxID=2738883 RepID=UPI003B9697B6
MINIRVRLADFSTYTRQRKLSSATDSDVEIARVGWELFEQNGYVGKALRLIESEWSSLKSVQPGKRGAVSNRSVCDR